MHQLAKVHANVERNCWHLALCHYPGITTSNAPGLLVAFVRDVIERFRLTVVNLQRSVTANIFWICLTLPTYEQLHVTVTNGGVN